MHVVKNYNIYMLPQPTPTNKNLLHLPFNVK